MNQEPPRRPSRLRAAWQVLFGQRLVPEQIQAEWQEYQLIFNDLLGRQSALLARHAKAEKKRLERLSELSSPSDRQLSLLPSSSKAELRSRVAQMRGLGPMQSRVGSAVPSPSFHQEEEEAE